MAQMANELCAYLYCTYTCTVLVVILTPEPPVVIFTQQQQYMITQKARGDTSIPRDRKY